MLLPIGTNVRVAAQSHDHNTSTAMTTAADHATITPRWVALLASPEDKPGPHRAAVCRSSVAARRHQPAALLGVGRAQRRLLGAVWWHNSSDQRWMHIPSLISQHRCSRTRALHNTRTHAHTHTRTHTHTHTRTHTPPPPGLPVQARQQTHSGSRLREMSQVAPRHVLPLPNRH